MKRWTIPILAMAILSVVGFGCSGSSTGPLSPETELSLTADSLSDNADLDTNTILWGWYDVFVDVDSQTAGAVLNRTAMFTANLVNILNGSPSSLTLQINAIEPGAGFLDIDIDVSLSHPFPGMDQFNGYDVRGVFMGDGSAALTVNSDLVYPVRGTDQFMPADPDAGNGAPDGYTRWFNAAEFSLGGVMPLVEYTQGKAASPGYTGSATLCPYRYFADGLGANGDLFDFLTATSSDGVFSAGETNTRNYYLRFPDSKGVQFSYAVLADWEAPDVHPSHAPEAQAVRVTVTDDIYYINETNKGGDLILDFDVFAWETESGGPADFDIIIESTVIGTAQQFDSEPICIGGGDNYSTYHVEIPADNLTGAEGNEYWVILQLEDYDHSNPFSIENLAGTDPLCAFFRFDLYVSDTPYNTPPDVLGIEDEEGSGTYAQIVSVSDVKTYYAIFNDPDPGQNHTFTWYIVDDGETPGPSDEVTMPVDWSTWGVGEYDIYVDVFDGFETGQGGPYDLTVIDAGGGVITFGGTGTEYILGFTVDSEGGKWSGGYFFGQANLDPDGNEPYDQIGTGGNMWLNKIDAGGDFEWGYAWPGIDGYHSYVWEMVVDDSDNVYVVGHFVGTMDFDPGSGVDNHVASGGNGPLDAFLMKFDSDGNYIWGLSWGGPSNVTAFDIAIYDNSYLYITGYFFGTADIDPTDDVDSRTATSGSGNVTDGYLIKVDLDGNYYWGETWGANGTTYSFRCAVDGSGNPCATGTYRDTVDLDPTGGVQNHTSNGWGDTFIIKFLADSTWDWSLGFGGNSWDQINELVADSSGNIYGNGGSASTSVDFDPGPGDETIILEGSYDGFLIKFNEDGDFLWVDMFGEPGHDNTWGIDLDSSGNIIMGGHFNGTIDLDPGPGEDLHTTYSAGKADAFVVKLTSDGEHIWGRSWGGNGYDNSYSVDIGDNGLIHVAGRFEETVDFDPGSGVDERTSNGGYDTFINVLLPNGWW